MTIDSVVILFFRLICLLYLGSRTGVSEHYDATPYTLWPVAFGILAKPQRVMFGLMAIRNFNLMTRRQDFSAKLFTSQQ